jgi:hypothetical protein
MNVKELLKYPIRTVMEKTKEIPINQGGLSIFFEKVVLCIEDLQSKQKKEISLELDLQEFQELVRCLCLNEEQPEYQLLERLIYILERYENK